LILLIEKNILGYILFKFRKWVWIILQILALRFLIKTRMEIQFNYGEN